MWRDHGLWNSACLQTSLWPSSLRLPYSGAGVSIARRDDEIGMSTSYTSFLLHHAFAVSVLARESSVANDSKLVEALASAALPKLFEGFRLFLEIFLFMCVLLVFGSIHIQTLQEKEVSSCRLRGKRSSLLSRYLGGACLSFLRMSSLLPH